MSYLGINYDYDSTKEYRFKYEGQCDCAYCRNYYKTFKTNYPETSKFLERFGLDVEFPLEIMPLQYDKLNNVMEYISFYPIKGTLAKDEIILNIEELELRIFKGKNSNNPCPNPKMEDPYLLVEVSGIKLPWVLDKNIE